MRVIDEENTQSESFSISPIQLYILTAIANGHTMEKGISRVIRISSDALKQGIQELASNGLIRKEGYIFKSWRLWLETEHFTSKRLGTISEK